MERVDAYGDGPGDDRRRPTLRIGGYIPGHAEPVAEPEPGPATPPRPAPPVPLPALPNIADYWPDAPRSGPRVTAAGPPEITLAGPPDGRHRRPAALAAVAGLVVIGTLLLARPLTGLDRQSVAAPATTAGAAGVEPGTTPSSVTGNVPSGAPGNVPSSAPGNVSSAAPTAPPAPPATRPATAAPTATPEPAITTARFELVTGVTELSVRTADLEGAEFRVTTPKDSGLDVDTAFTDGTLRVSAEPDGSASGNGRVDVLLSDDIVWRLRMGAGVHTASFDLGTGTVGDIDLIGGAQTVDIELGRLDGTLPILMAGGVHTWRISTSDEVPVRIVLASGAGDVSVYGDERGGVGGGTTVREGHLDGRAGLDIDAEAGIGSLDIDSD